MAKDNLVLGTANKSLGDITLFRRDGRQMSRARVRVIGNPRSEGQSQTRNYLAPVTKFYGPLATVLAKSWQGCNKAKSHAMFLKTNIDLAKREGWFLDKGTPFFPMPYQLSFGSLTPFRYAVEYDTEAYYATWFVAFGTSTPITIANLSAKLVEMGYQNGDVLTFIFVMRDAAGSFAPLTVQFAINTSSHASIMSTFPSELQISSSAQRMEFEGLTRDIFGFAVIVARKVKGEWLRSTQFLAVPDELESDLVSEASRRSAIASYSNPEGNTGGDAYIDGDGQAYNVAAENGRALLFYGGQYNAQLNVIGDNKFIMLKPANTDDHFYAHLAPNRWLATNSAGSLDPANWRMVATAPTGATEDNSILYEDGDSMWLYLQSIGWTGA